MKQKPPMLWALYTIRSKLPKLLLLFVLEVSSSLLTVGFALGSKEIINSAVSGDWDAFIRAVIVQALIITGILLSVFLLRNMRELLMADLGREWRKKMFHALLQGRYAEVSAYHTGELMNRLTNDVRILDDGLVHVLPSFISMIVQVCVIMVVIIVWEPILAAVVVITGIVLVLCSGFLRKRVNRIHKKVSETEGEVFGFLQESLEKLFVIQAMEVSDEIERRSDKLLNKWFHVKKRKKNVFLISGMLMSVFSYAVRFGTLAWGAYGVMINTFTYGELTALLQLVSQLQHPLTNVSGIIPKYTAMTVAAERLKELFELGNTEEMPDFDAAAAYEQMTEISCEDLTFSYDNDTVLEHCVFSIPKNSFAVIMGTSGIGKSTLLKLMLGMYEPEGGILAVCGPKHRTVLGRNTRSLFSYVPQGNLLFSGTIRDNLLLINPDVSEDRLREAIYVSAMDLFLNQLPEGLDTTLGENGSGLSEGQAQRVAIARAILTGAPILLLDEATSALDAETELIVLERIGQLKDRTCIAVTHRPAALNKADRQLIIHDKKIRCVAVENTVETAGNSKDWT